MSRLRWTRGRAAGLALATAVLTAGGGIALGHPTDHAPLAGLFVVLAVVAATRPGWLVTPLLAGQLLAGSLLLGSAGTGIAGTRIAEVGLLVVGIVLTAEFLGIAARLRDTPGRDPSGELRRVGAVGLLGGVVFAGVALLGRLPAVPGLLGLGLALGGLVVVAIVLERRGHGLPRRPGLDGVPGDTDTTPP